MDFADYIGLPWVAGAQGPNQFDCMGFFRHVQGLHFGIDVPSIVAPDVDDASSLVALFGRHPERKRWALEPTPTHGCAVIIRRPLHIGTWLGIDGGGVLHCVRGIGVVFTPDASWPCSGFGEREFFKLAEKAA